MKFEINFKKIEEDMKKGADAVGGFMQGAWDFGSKVASDISSNVNEMIEKSKNEAYLQRLKQYNPLFPEKYKSEDFNLPNMIMIVDDAVRRDIDVCQGAIGWITTDTDVETLCLYDEFIPNCGIKFIPNATCDAVYYVDSFDRNRFIRTDYLFIKAHEERLAELENIAYNLGAKHCSIEISESTANTQNHSDKTSFGGNFKLLNISGNVEQSSVQGDHTQVSGRIDVEFEGHSNPQRPALKWFANDDTITGLVEMCCSGKYTVKNKTLTLSGSTSATMSQKVACAIDSTVKKIAGGGAQFSMNDQASKEHHSKLLFHIEF